MTRSTRPAEDLIARILIVDDDVDMRELLTLALRVDGDRQIEVAASAAEARAMVSRCDYDVVITDLSMPGESGLSLMQWANEHRPGPAWIVLTGYGTFDTAVKALQLGAFDFLSKPIEAPQSLRNAVRNAITERRLRAERDRLQLELQHSNARLREHVVQLEEAFGLLHDQTDALRADLRRAGIIQQALLPQRAPDLGDFHVRAYYRPSQSVGGDLYDVARLDERHVALVVADAAGHGLAAAMLAVLFRSQLPFVDPDTGTPHSPGDVLRRVNRSICKVLPTPGLFLTAAYCLLDTATGEASIASAGHPPLLWLRAHEDIERIFHTGPALGLDADADFAEKRIRLGRGDGLFFYSDGLYERFPTANGVPSETIANAFRSGDAEVTVAFEKLFATARSSEEDASVADDVTALLLAAQPGASQLDNGAPPPLDAPRRASAASGTLVGVDARHEVLSVQGCGDWARSTAFHAECAKAIGRGRHVMVDLTLCQQLDSTFLGTIHQLCELADAADVEFRLQGTSPAVEALFEELGMQNVIDHLVPSMLPLPTRMRSLDDVEPDPLARVERLLRAHEGLASLNDRNRREFDPLIAQLRREMDRPRG